MGTSIVRGIFLNTLIIKGYFWTLMWKGLFLNTLITKGYFWILQLIWYYFHGEEIVLILKLEGHIFEYLNLKGDGFEYFTRNGIFLDTLSGRGYFWILQLEGDIFEYFN